MVTVYPRCIQRVGSLYNDATFRLRASYTKITTEIPFEPVILPHRRDAQAAEIVCRKDSHSVLYS